jgi:pimeloyl-ACP methyl ester carboxylesterase
MRRASVLALLAALVPLAACTDDGSTQRSGPAAADRLARSECPAEVASAVVGDVDCFLLSVPEIRNRPHSRTIRVHVTIVRAPKGSTEQDPVLVTSWANQPNYGGIAPLAQRVRRDVIMVDTRGTGHSVPALGCPEVSRLSTTAWAAPTGDRTRRDLLLTSVRSCRQRLVAAGNEVAAYDAVEAAADVIDLRHALGIQQWNVASYGVGSRLALELLRQDRAGFRTLVLDSPDVPGTDYRTLAGPATEDAVLNVLAACAQDRQCHTMHPEPDRLLDRAMASLEWRPLHLQVDHDGKLTSVVLDPGLLARALRQLLSDGGSSGPFFRLGHLPALLEDVVHRRPSLTADVATMLRYDDGLCLGYRTPCLPVATTSLPVELTLLCRDIAPFSQQEPPALGAGFREAYSQGLPWDLCSVWPVTARTPEVADRPASDVPTLVALGSYAPYSPERAVRRDLSGLSEASYVTAPGRTHNVLPGPCVADVRQEWLQDPRTFTANPCEKEVPVLWD